MTRAHTCAPMGGELDPASGLNQVATKGQEHLDGL